jgi:hypothetical protein
LTGTLILLDALLHVGPKLAKVKLLGAHFSAESIVKGWEGHILSSGNISGFNDHVDWLHKFIKFKEAMSLPIV